jgi:uncharacterized protein (TIGR02996 family)
MNDEAAFQAALSARPDDNHLRLIYADWLDERGDPRGELLRLLHTLTQSIAVPDRDRLEDRLRSLVAAGVPAVGPFFTNSIGMKFAWIPAGTFLMGSPPEEELRSDHEFRHPVTLTRGVYLGIHLVTQSSYQVVVDNNPSEYQGDDLPVHGVSRDCCQAFLRHLSELEGRVYHLPTEAEWEYACRAGTTTPFHFGKECNGEQANCDGNDPYGTGETGPYLGSISPVGSYTPNAFGLYDMHGNVWEWCADGYEEYPKTAVTDPRSPENGEFGVLRAGSWIEFPRFCRAAYREGTRAGHRAEYAGLRLAFRPD